ncbi:MAG: hypothetical protein AAF141_01995 [Pseudomonadota bacterium]
MNMDATAVGRYFAATDAALKGLGTYLADGASPTRTHNLIGRIAAQHLTALEASFEAWQHRVSFTERFRISKAQSGFPTFHNILDLTNDAKKAEPALASLPSMDQLRADMADFILVKKAFPTEIQKQLAQRAYYERIAGQELFQAHSLPVTERVSVNPKNGRPYYVVHWASYDGTQHLPVVYTATIEDSSEEMVRTLVRDGKLNERVDIPLPVGGLLNPELAHQFDDFVEKNASLGLTLTTIGTNLDADFPHLHLKQLQRFVLGPFYHAGLTEHGSLVANILAKVRKPENAWLLEWSIQELWSMNEREGKAGFWSSTPPVQEFFINTEDLEAVRLGVSDHATNVLVPHQAYQAIYAAGRQDEIFAGLKTHIISGNEVLREF